MEFKGELNKLKSKIRGLNEFADQYENKFSVILLLFCNLLSSCLKKAFMNTMVRIRGSKNN